MTVLIDKPVSPLAIANTFLDMADMENRSLTPLEVQKLVYFAHGWHLAIKGNALFNERVEAWPYGPVIESVYHAFKHFKKKVITSRATISDFQEGTVIGELATLPKDMDKQTQSIIHRVWDQYKNLSGAQFVEITHKPGTPWSIIASIHGGSPRSAWIPDELIRQHFVDLANKNKTKSSG